MGPTLSTAPGSGRLASSRVSSHGKSGALLERREITTGTAFRGPGEQDAFGLVTPGVTSGRYFVDLGVLLVSTANAGVADHRGVSDPHRCL